MRHLLLVAYIACLGWASVGCSQQANQTATHDHHHETAPHMPSSLGDLCHKMRNRLKMINKRQTSPQLEAELTDLVSWAPEFAADTDIEESLWIPIYESSEQVRASIEKDANLWDQSRVENIAQLCQLSEDAWMTLDADERIDRYQPHSHHDHDHHDHDHTDHDHTDHEHSEHDDGDHQPRDQMKR